MRLIALSGCTAAVAALAIAAASGAPGRLDSGIRGRLVYGPTCPVERPGRDCTRPYAGSVTVRREPVGTVVARVRSGPDGRFTLRLRAGRYRLAPRSGRPYPRAAPQTVIVRRHHFSAVTIRYESGIR